MTSNRGTMSRVTEVRLVDDIDGSNASETVTFGLDRRQYEMDLSTRNAAKLRAALAPFVASARPSSGRRRSSNGSTPEVSYRSRADRGDSGWAREHGHKVADRGRIPAAVIDAYEKAAG